MVKVTASYTQTAVRPPLPHEQFVPVEGGFALEHAGPVVRLWCDVCNKHQLLPDKGAETIGATREAHRCGPRTSPGDSGGER